MRYFTVNLNPATPDFWGVSLETPWTRGVKKTPFFDFFSFFEIFTAQRAGEKHGLLEIRIPGISSEHSNGGGGGGR